MLAEYYPRLMLATPSMALNEQLQHELSNYLQSQLPIRSSEKHKPQVDAPPPASYHDLSFFKVEMSAIANDWFFVAPETVVPNPGDFFSFRVLNQPLILIRQSDQSLRVFGNHCKHRYMKLLDGNGTCSKIVCPYHSWTYSLDGHLQSAPEFSDFPQVQKDEVKLEEVPLMNCNGLIFVYAGIDERRQNSKTLSDQTGLKDCIDRALDGLVDFQDFTNLVPLIKSTHSIWNCNWKLLVENFNESYHLSFTHRKSIGPESPSSMVRKSRRPLSSDPHPRFAVHYNFSRDNKGKRLPEFGEDSNDDSHCQIISLFPNCLLSVSPGSVFWMRLNPLKVNRTEVTWGVSVSPDLVRANDHCLEDFVAEHVAKIEASTVEDRKILEGLQEGVQFQTLNRGWIHQRSETQIPRFWQYLASQLLRKTKSRGKAPRSKGRK